MGTPSSSASFCSSIFHNRTREPLLPPPSAVIREAAGAGIALAPHELPPASNGVGRESRSVVVDAHTDPSDVVGDIVDTIGCGAPEFGNDEIVHANFLGRTLRSPFASGVLEIADKLLLLGIDRDRRLTCRERFFHPIVDVVELRVTIGIVGSLAGLAVGLQAVIEPVQEFADERPANRMAHVAQALAELAKALGSPQQRRLRIASRLWLDQRAQIIEQIRIRLAQRPTTAAHSAYPFQVRRLARTQFGQPASDRAARDTDGTHHRNDPTVPGRCRLGCRKTPPTALVEHRSEGLEALAYGRFVDHAKTI